MKALKDVEPTAYLYKTASGTIFGISAKEGVKGIPLYTAEQITPKVEMTQAEFEEFNSLWDVEDYSSLAVQTITQKPYQKLKDMIFSGSVEERVKSENRFNVLWANFNPDLPEETIEIVPEKKWFVKHVDRNQFLYLKGNKFNYLTSKKDAAQFDTEEEARQWENPKAKAVLLDVAD